MLEFVQEYFLSKALDYATEHVVRTIFVVAAIGAISWGLLWKRHEKWARGVLGALAVAVLLAMVQTSIKMQQFFERVAKAETPTATSQNIGDLIRTWAFAYHLGLEPMPARADVRFNYAITSNTPDRTTIHVWQLEARPTDLMFGLLISLDENMSKTFTALPDAARHRTLRDLIIEVARAGYSWEIAEPPLRSIEISKVVPITKDYDTSAFLNDFDQVKRMRAVIVESVRFAKY